MRKVKTFITAVICLFGLTLGFSQNQAAENAKMNKDQIQNKTTMKTYVIEREIPDAGKLTPEQLKGISQKSNKVVAEMSPNIEWINSYVTNNKVYCVYRAENKEAIKEHAEKGGFPANKISELSTIIDPSTAKD